MAKNEFKDLKLYYSYSGICLRDGDYKEAEKGFRYLLEHGIEPQKSAMGLITAYACSTKYAAALKAYEKYKEYLTGPDTNRDMFLDMLTGHLMRETSLLKKYVRGYVSGFKMAGKMKKTNEVYMGNKQNLLAQILLSYWYAVLGKRPYNSEEMLKQCLEYKALDNEFRWKLLEKLAVTDKTLMEDTSIASLFTKIPRFVDRDYINLLLFTSLCKSDLAEARDKIEVQRMNGVELTNDVLWNYLELCVDKGDIDDLAVSFAKRLFAKGWVDPVIAEVFRYAKSNLTKHNVSNELDALELYGM
jgi:G:T/U-mismatch repair DNA glycosylase